MRMRKYGPIPMEYTRFQAHSLQFREPASLSLLFNLLITDLTKATTLRLGFHKINWTEIIKLHINISVFSPCKYVYTILIY
jgi:hypothetical protein